MTTDDLQAMLADLGLDDATESDIERLGPALADLAELAAGTTGAPPPALRAGVLSSAAAERERGRPLVGAEPASALAVYASQVDALARVLAERTDADWELPARPYDWTVHGLVGHLVGVERYTGSVLGLWDFDAGHAEGLDHLARTEPVVTEELRRRPADTVAEWQRLAARIVDHVASAGPDRLHDEVVYEGWPFHVDSMLVARSFELWTHADDVRRAVGLPLDAPAPEELRAMATVSVGSLAAAVGLVDGDQLGRPFKIVLTGPGGGTWIVGDEPEATLVADVVDYCRVVARRLEPADLDADRLGDPTLVRDLLDAARVLAA